MPCNDYTGCVGGEDCTCADQKYSLKNIEDIEAKATIDWLDGYRTGNLNGYEEGLSAGWSRGYEDVIYQIKRFMNHNYDPELESLLKQITGEI